MNRFIRLADYTGITASMLCLVHCIATPFLLVAFPLVGLAHEDASFHHAMALFVTIPVIAALVPGFIIHQRWSTLALGGLGLTCFLVAVFLIGPRFGEVAETILAVIGGAFLLTAHFRNRLLCKRCSPQDRQASCCEDKCNYVARRSAHGD